MAPDPLKIYPSGLRLENSEVASIPDMPPQVFAVSIDENVLADLIFCAQQNQEIALSLGKQPTLLYDGTSYIMPRIPEDPHPHEVYFTKPLDDNKLASKIPVFGDLHTKPQQLDSKKRSTEETSKKSSRTSTGSNKSPFDNDLEQLQSSMARHEAHRGNTVVLSGVPPTDMSSARNRNILRAAETTASQPGSPNGSVRSGSPAPESGALAKSVLERNKQQRFMIVHELAVKDRSTEYLRDRWAHKPEDFDMVVKKAAEFDSNTKTWSLTKNYWKELDVWKYNYEHENDRQTAISNAISKYDRMRLSANQIEWERLLPEEERGKGKGKTLSKIQANLDRPMGKLPGADDKAESMARTKSNPLPKPTSKKTEKEKRGPATATTMKTAAARIPKAKSTTAPAASTPPTSVPPNRKMPLSAEIISDSDNESSQGSVVASSDEHRTKARKPSPADSTGKSSIRESPSKPSSLASMRPNIPAKLNVSPTKIATKPAATKTANTRTSTSTKASAKRAREDSDDESSGASSEVPLSKRQKNKISAQSTTKSRTIDPVRMTPSSSSNGLSKKISSPAVRVTPVSPSSVSDWSEAAVRIHSDKPTVAKKRPLESDGESVKYAKDSKVATKEKVSKAKITFIQDENNAPHVAKRPKVSFDDVVNKAARFNLVYQRYYIMHNKISNMINPPKHEIDRLLDLRESLKEMKQKIYNDHLLCSQ